MSDIFKNKPDSTNNNNIRDKKDSKLNPSQNLFLDLAINKDVAEHIGEFEGIPLLESAQLNYSVDWMKNFEEDDPLMNKFLPPTDSSKYRDDLEVIKSNFIDLYFIELNFYFFSI